MIHKLETAATRVLNGIEAYRHRNETYISHVAAAQAEVARLNPHPYYVRRYRQAETKTWLPIAKWIYEDRLSRRSANCLDIGCAFGTLALYCRRILDCNMFCIDCTDAYMSKTLAAAHGITFAVNNIELDSFPWNQRFDIIVLTEVIEHWNFHPLPTLKKIAGLLTENGRLYLSTPNAADVGRVTKYYASMADMPPPESHRAGIQLVNDHVWQFNDEELLDIARAAGFTVRRCSFWPRYRSKINLGLGLAAT